MSIAYLSTAEVDRRERVAAHADAVKMRDRQLSELILSVSAGIREMPVDSPFMDALEDLLGDLESARDGVTAHLRKVENGRYYS